MEDGKTDGILISEQTTKTCTRIWTRWQLDQISGL